MRLWNNRTARWIFAIAAGIALTAAMRIPSTLACGPFFPTSAFDGGDRTLLDAPVADFANEIQPLLPKPDPAFHAKPPQDIPYNDPYGQTQTDQADVADLTAATGNAALAAQLQAWRKDLHAGKKTPVPAGLPAEFALYETGAAFYHASDLPAARQQ